ncbi:carbonic anhydrase 14 isoform X2 [Hemicordylus capensis]|uniref:carbonic anhydrase 14 isoform X2 n=1 Tax=Hemicordylus capensis TaxID=884348 RepID=UPI002304855E|nr:carbonic anhydrase 14 isoform X2 [Hemicordylus capensis]
MLLAFILLHSFYQTLAAKGGAHWSYDAHSQETWPEAYPDCGLKAQSPIDIQMGSVQYDPSLPPIEPEGYRNPGSDPFALTNNGHTVQMSLAEGMNLHGLPNIYTAVQLHFHWGSKGSSGGSEHLIDGQAFPGELHVVHFNSEKYANVSEAMHHPDGLAVLGIFLEVGKMENPAYNNIFNQVDKIQYAGEEDTVSPFNIRNLLPEHLGHYFRYNGSLTTPPCYQSVLWTVFHQPVQISAAQIEKLQKSVYSSKAGSSTPQSLVDTFRHPQLLNGRVVFSSFPAGQEACRIRKESSLPPLHGVPFETRRCNLAQFSKSFSIPS